MGGKIAILIARRGQMPTHERKVISLFAGNLQPVPVKIVRHAGKAPDDIQRQVDGIEFDMGDRVHERRFPLRGLRRAYGYLTRVYQLRALRPARQRLRWLQDLVSADG